MDSRRAVMQRLQNLCQEKGLSLNALANLSGVPPMTVYCLFNGKSKNPGVVTLKKLCDGLEITLSEFFDSELFLGLEQEIQ